MDSLQNLLKTANDTTQVNLLRTLGIKSRFIDKEQAVAYGLQSLEKSKEIGFKVGEAKALYSLGLTHGMTDSYANSLEYLNKCLAVANENKDYSMVCDVYNSMGIVYKRIGDYPSSQESYLKSLKVIDSFNLQINAASVYINLGVLHDLMDEREEAIASYQKALEIYDGPDPEAMKNDVEVNLAIMSYTDGDYQTALDKFLKIVPYWRQEGNNIKLYDLYSNIGHCYLQLEQWNNAEEYLFKALDLANQLSLEQGKAFVYHNLASLMLNQSKLKEAIGYSKQNLDVLQGMEGTFERKREAHQKAYEIYEASGQLKKAIFHLNRAQEYKDSLMNEAKVKEIQNLQVRHEVYVKDREIEANTLELALLNTRVEQNRKRTLYLIVISILLLFSASLLYFRYLAKKRSNAILSEKNRLISEQRDTIGQMNRQLEKRMLRAQMNPHFIFNSLGSIQHLISTNDKKGALTYLSKFSKLLRQVLESSVNISLVLSEEIELLKIYVELEALRFDHSFSYQFEIDENLDIDAHEVPMLLVQPYIENAIIHGLMPKEGNKELKVSFTDKGDNIECVIEDNGVGLTQTEARKSNRISRGMSITERRIQALKQHSAQQLVKIENLYENRSGTRVTILIPKE
ncbi:MULTISPECIES: tetratricopeptide repeat protein [unclassified Allomuricauda]|uniref:tetratricopeptide repeat-containing sensor histidine kinase n=1 Tax=unclassified Allomuricauda TaxID=2615049 RepID=UPI00273D712F|nr:MULTISPECIES: tetratricopeptide repeat protein [unclassified Allomuricauda]